MLGPTRILTSFDLSETNLGISRPVTDPVFPYKFKLIQRKNIRGINFITISNYITF